MRFRFICLAIVLAAISACAKLEDAARQVDAKVADLFSDAPQTEAQRHYRQGLRLFNGEDGTSDPTRAVAEFRAAAVQTAGGGTQTARCRHRHPHTPSAIAERPS